MGLAVKNNMQRITIALLFTVVAMEKQKVIIMPETRPLITTVSYAVLLNILPLFNKKSSLG